MYIIADIGMYEEGQLKGRHTRKLTQADVQKALEGWYACKLSHLKVFQGIPVITRTLLLATSLSNLLKESGWKG